MNALTMWWAERRLMNPKPTGKQRYADDLAAEGPEGCDRLAKLLGKTPDKFTGHLVGMALVRAGDVRGIEAAIAPIILDSQVKSAIEAAAPIAAAAQTQLLGLLKNPNGYARYIAMSLLSKHPSPAIAPELVNVLCNPDARNVHYDASETLAKLARSGEVSAVVSALQCHKDEDVAVEFCEILAASWLSTMLDPVRDNALVSKNARVRRAAVEATRRLETREAALSGVKILYGRDAYMQTEAENVASGYSRDAAVICIGDGTVEFVLQCTECLKVSSRTDHCSPGLTGATWRCGSCGADRPMCIAGRQDRLLVHAARRRSYLELPEDFDGLQIASVTPTSVAGGKAAGV